MRKRDIDALKRKLDKEDDGARIAMLRILQDLRNKYEAAVDMLVIERVKSGRTKEKNDPS